MAPTAFARLPIGSIRARGWLHEQLRRSAEGLTGRMMEIWPDVGPGSGWLGGKGENWERGPYYARGLLALAHTLGDEWLVQRARPWVEWSLGSQRADGFFGPADNDDWWPRMPMLEAIRIHYDATGDARVLPFMTRYFRHQLAHLPVKPLDAWAKPRGGDNLDSVLWLYHHTGEPFLLDLADQLHQQTSDWVTELSHDGVPSDAFEFAHGVNRAMGMKEPAVYFQRSKDERHLAALRRGWQQTLRYHGQIQGTFSCDEFLHGLGSTQGAEFCAIVELLSTLATGLRISGELWPAEAMERLAYNALPAILTADHHGHQYFQQPNQVVCMPGPHHFGIHHDTDLLFGPLTGYGCCAANFHIGWPLVVNHLWVATPDRGLAAMLFAPCEVTAPVGDGQQIRISEDTLYPFAEEVCLTIHTPRPVVFALSARIPGWASSCRIAVNGRRRPVASRPTAARTPANAPAGGTMITETREWRDGDTMRVKIPMRVRMSHWERGSVGVERGPLVYALRIGEEWRRVGGTVPFADYEVHPTTPWNYALALDPEAPERSIRVRRGQLAAQPWAQDGANARLTVKGRRLPDWTLDHGDSGPIPETGLNPGTRPETLTLIPFGCARLRISMFPVCQD